MCLATQPWQASVSSVSTEHHPTCDAHLRLGSEDGVEEQGAGATEGVRELRSAHPDDLINPLLGGLGSGGLLGRLQGRGAADEGDEDDEDSEIQRFDFLGWCAQGEVGQQCPREW